LSVRLNLLPPGYAFNYASVSLLVSLLSLTAAVFAVVTYPAYLAGRLVTPSLRRKWELPTRPRGDVWEIPLMVRVTSESEARGIVAFLREYYSGFGAEKRFFVVTSILGYDPGEARLRIRVNLAPFEAHVSQDVSIDAVRDKSGTYNFLVRLNRLSGSKDVWRNNNYYFIDDLRKQILLWRSLPLDVRRKYEKRDTS